MQHPRRLPSILSDVFYRESGAGDRADRGDKQRKRRR